MTDTFERLKSALADRYRIEREIGAGGMATVYLAEDLKHHRQVAVKVLRPDLAAALGPERFLREIEVAAQLHHPHILPLYDSGEVDGFLYYVMPYEEGQSLRERLAKEGELPIAEAVRLLRDVVDALAHAHEHGVVHRDIKPDNVMLSGRHALVTDFGVAKAVSEATGRQQLTTVGVALGTPAYMAPEQAVADPHIDHRADIYAVGVLAYELLTGHPPFTGTTPQAVLTAQVTKAPEPIADHRAAAPPALAALVMRCLEKKPADRWQSAEEVLAQIEALATPTAGTGPVTPAQSAGAVKKTAGVVAAVLVALALSILLFMDFGSRPDTDSNKLAVIPFAPVSPGDTALSRIGRELAVLLSTSLDGVGDFRTVLGSTVLAQSIDPTRAYTPSEAVALARSFGAGKAVHGNLLRQDGSVRIEAVVTGTNDGSEMRVSIVVPFGDVAAITDSTSWALLRALWQEGEPPSPRLGDKLGTHSIDALRAFLEGEQAEIEMRYRDAEAAYERAIAADSTFWLAYRRYAVARQWFNRTVRPEVRDAYISHLGELPEPERLIIEASLTEGLSRRHERLRAVTDRFPEYWPAWMAYADRLIHWGPLHAGTRTKDAEAAMERTVELNPRFIPAWQHLVWIKLMLGDSVGAEAALDTLDALDGSEVLAEATGWDWLAGERLLVQTRFGGTSIGPLLDSVTTTMAGTRSTFSDFHLLASSYYAYLGSPALQLEMSRQIAEKTPMRDATTTHRLGMAYAWAGRGAWDSALTLVDSLATAGAERAGFEAYNLAVLGAWLGGVDPAVVESYRQRAVTAAGQDVRALADLHWLDGLLAVSTADTSGMGAALQRLSADSSIPAELRRRSLSAFQTDMRGEPDRATQQMLDLVLEVRDQNGRFGGAVEPVHRLTLGRWLLARGDTAMADSVLRWYEGFYALDQSAWSLSVTQAIAMLERAQLHERWGRPEEARWFYREFLRRYDLPDESQRHLVEESQRALARLEGVVEVGNR